MHNIVNGKPAFEGVMKRQSVPNDKDSGITCGAKLRDTESIGSAKYPLELFQRFITVCLGTMKIVNGLEIDCGVSVALSPCSST